MYVGKEKTLQLDNGFIYCYRYFGGQFCDGYKIKKNTYILA